MQGIFRFVLILLFLLAFPGVVRADCAMVGHPAQPAGSMFYNIDHQVMQYCNGTDWIAAGSKTADSSLVGWWRFDETAGVTATDSSGSGNDGTLANGPVWLPNGGKIGGGLEFDGSNDYVITGTNGFDFSNGTGDFTIAHWIYPKSINNKAFIRIYQASYCPAAPAYIFTDLTSTAGASTIGKLGAFDSNNVSKFANSAADAITTNQWYHFVGVYKRSTNQAFVYINGVQSGSITDLSSQVGAIDCNPVNEGSYIGGAGTGWDFQGIIDDVRIYNRALSATEIQEIYGCGGEGTIYYTPDRKTLEYCNGMKRVALGPKQPFLTAADITPGLVGWWKFDEGTGETAYDSSSYGHDLTFVGTPTKPAWSAGVIGGATYYAGNHVTNSAVARVAVNSTSHPLHISGALTVAAWIRPTEDSGFDATIARSGSGTNTPFTFTISNNTGTPGTGDDLYLEHWNTTLNGWSSAGVADVVTYGVWQHVAVTRGADGITVKFYVNGVFAGQDVMSHPTDANAANYFQVGMNFGNGADFIGDIDDVRVYNRALSADEIAVLYDAGTASLPGPIAHWTFDETAGTVAADSSGNGNTGTLINFPADPSSRWVSGLIGGALDFDEGIDPPGNREHVDVGNDASLNSYPITVSAWVKDCNPGGAPGGDGIVGDQFNNTPNAYYMRCLDYNTLQVGLNGTWNVISASGTGDPTGWNLFAFSYDGSEAVGYINGQEVQRVLFTGGAPDFSRTTKIGMRSSNEDNQGGIIDDVRIYDRALSASEVQALYKSVAGTCSSPSGTAGTMIYNTDQNVPQYCDGTAWVVMEQ